MIKTPHIDALANSGTKFTRAYTTNSLCSPTRASIVTSLMPSQHGVHYALSDNFTLFPKDWNAVQEYRTLPLTLKDRGYNTALIGKFHLGIPYKPSLGFDYWVTFNVGDTDLL